jgi:hypothetical protein
VLLRVRYKVQRGNTSASIEGVQFIGRLLQHVLPTGLKRIRHYGLLMPRLCARLRFSAHSLLGALGIFDQVLSAAN